MSGHSLRPSDVPERGGGGPAAAAFEGAQVGDVKPLEGQPFAGGPRVHVPPIIVWLLVQLAALLLAALRVPLAAQYPQPAEFQAVRLMLAAQFFALAILFPWMLRTWGSALAVLGAGWAMLLASAMLSGETFGAAPAFGAFVTLWIMVFATLAQVRSARFQSVAVALAGAYVLGGPLLWYLRLEFAAGAPVERGIGFGPLLAVLATTPHLAPSAWIVTCGIECFALLAWKIDCRARERAISVRVNASSA